MPELPEVETIKRSLEKNIVGKKIIGIQILMPKLIKIPEIDIFVNTIKDQTITALARRGKYLIFNLDNGYSLITHLRMTGQYTYIEQGSELKKHTHVIFELNDGYELRYADIRRFGTIYLLGKNEFHLVKGLFELGPEPLGDEFTFETFQKSLSGKKSQLKHLLLNQKFVAGIGNIYADEILFEAGLHPEREIFTLNEEEIEALYKSIRKMIALGIENRGTSFRDYIDGDGNKGDFQKLLQVYGRAGEPCTKCGQQLLKKKVAGRSSVYCSYCQQ